MTRKSIDILAVVPDPEPELSRPVGRPSDYKEEYAQQVYKLCLLGTTDAEMAKYFNISDRTLYDWKNKYPEFLQAIKDGKENADVEVAFGLNKRARGFEYYEEQPVKIKEVEYNDQGKKISEIERVEIVKVLKVVPADSKAASFWLKNRKSDKWRDKHQLVDDEDNPIPQLVVIRPQETAPAPAEPSAPTEPKQPD